jgi:hypothetical protein
VLCITISKDYLTNLKIPFYVVLSLGWRAILRQVFFHCNPSSVFFLKKDAYPHEIKDIIFSIYFSLIIHNS